MAQIGPEITIAVERYKRQLAAMGIRVERMFLFGSQVGGDPREGSDIDFS